MLFLKHNNHSKKLIIMKEDDKEKESPAAESHISNKAEWTKVELIKTLYPCGFLTMIRSIIFSGLLTLLLWRVISHKVLIVWLSRICLVMLLRYHTYFRPGRRYPYQLRIRGRDFHLCHDRLREARKRHRNLIPETAL